MMGVRAKAARTSLGGCNKTVMPTTPLQLRRIVQRKLNKEKTTVVVPASLIYFVISWRAISQGD
jgi:hypothetical protein